MTECCFFFPPYREEVWRVRPVSFSIRPLCGARRQCVSATVPSSSHLAGRSCPTWAEWRASGSRGVPAWWSGSSGSTTQRRLAWGSDTVMARWRLTAARIYEHRKGHRNAAWLFLRKLLPRCTFLFPSPSWFKWMSFLIVNEPVTWYL